MPADRTLMAGAGRVMASAFDVAKVRKDFPILSRQVYGKPLVYLDNAASAQKPQAVLDALQRAYGEDYANVHRGLHFLANASTDNYEGARKAAARFLNAASDQEIVFTKNATEGDQSGGAVLRRHAHRRGRRDRAHHHGAPFQHRALAFPPRAARREAEMGSGDGGRRIPA